MYNPLNVYNPLEIVTESPIIAFASSCCIWDLIWNTQFTVPLKFWFELNNDGWFSLTDEIIDLIGYKCQINDLVNDKFIFLVFYKCYEWFVTGEQSKTQK